eukprot:1186402-Prorocentrum_minimum.AAC.1
MRRRWRRRWRRWCRSPRRRGCAHRCAQPQMHRHTVGFTATPSHGHTVRFTATPSDSPPHRQIHRHTVRFTDTPSDSLPHRQIRCFRYNPRWGRVTPVAQLDATDSIDHCPSTLICLFGTCTCCRILLTSTSSCGGYMASVVSVPSCCTCTW